jgi:hypothetical protein
MPTLSTSYCELEPTWCNTRHFEPYSALTLWNCLAGQALEPHVVHFGGVALVIEFSLKAPVGLREGSQIPLGIQMVTNQRASPGDS